MQRSDHRDLVIYIINSLKSTAVIDRQKLAIEQPDPRACSFDEGVPQRNYVRLSTSLYGTKMMMCAWNHIINIGIFRKQGKKDVK